MKKEKSEKNLIKTFLKYIGQKLAIKYNNYKNNPQLILFDLFQLYQTIKYRIQNYIDPPPKQKRNENNRDYFDRIDPKYGLRYYTLLMSKRFFIDVALACAEIDKSDLNKKEKEEFKEFFRLTANIDQSTEENYNRYIIRSRYLKG